MDIRFLSGTNSSVSVGTGSTQILQKNTARRYTILVNDSNETMYLGLGAAAVMNKGIPLLPNGAALEIDGERPFTGEVFAICASGGKNLSYFES